MKIVGDEASRQYVLEQAILEETSVIRYLFTEARLKWEPENGNPDPTLTFEEYMLEVNTLETEIVGRLNNLLRSVTASYKEEGK